MKTLAVIPARGGSKRIPRKNIRKFLGKPVIAYSIQAALDSALFDEVMVSTDDVEIGQVAQAFGARIPFFRSAQTSDDYAAISDVLAEVLTEYEARSEIFDDICVLYPAAPFVTGARIAQGIDLLRRGGHDAVFYVVRYSHPIQRALTLSGGRLSYFHPEHMNTRTQDLTPAYHDSGQLFWITRQSFERRRSVFVENIGAVELPESEVQDIDSPEDWELAELKYRLWSGQH
jgi:pseudaminic acid cytidylyltransferase